MTVGTLTKAVATMKSISAAATTTGAAIAASTQSVEKTTAKTTTKESTRTTSPTSTSSHTTRCKTCTAEHYFKYEKLIKSHGHTHDICKVIHQVKV